MPARGGDGRRKRLLAPARTVWRYHGRACLLQHARARRLARRERGLTENDIACGGVIWELSLMSACSQWRWAVWWVGAVYCVAGSPPYSRTASTLHCGALDGTWVASTTQECRGLQVSLLANASAAAGCGWHARLARVTSFADGGGAQRPTHHDVSGDTTQLGCKRQRRRMIARAVGDSGHEVRLGAGGLRAGAADALPVQCEYPVGTRGQEPAGLACVRPCLPLACVWLSPVRCYAGRRLLVCQQHHSVASAAKLEGSWKVRV